MKCHELDKCRMMDYSAQTASSQSVAQPAATVGGREQSALISHGDNFADLGLAVMLRWRNFITIWKPFKKKS